MKAIDLASVFEKYPNNLKDVFDVVKKRHLDFLLPDVYKLLKAKNIRFSDMNEIIVESPFEIGDEAKQSIEKKLDLKIDKTKINKEMIAGFRVYTKDKILDASLDTLLKQIIK